MTALDAADLVLIAGRILGIETSAALAQMDIAAAEEALAAAWPSGTDLSGPDAAAAAAVGLLHALLRHRPFPRHGLRVAVAAGLQFLSLNGWRADLDPPATAAVVVEALASGQLEPAAAAAWLAPRLSPERHTSSRKTPARNVPASRASARQARSSPAGAGRAPAGARLALAGGEQVPAGASRAGRGRPPAVPATHTPGNRAVAGALLAVAVGGAALLAAACSRAPNVPAAPTSVVHTVGAGASPAAPSATAP